MDTEEVIAQIREAFGANAYPGDPFLQGSFDGCEPYDEVSALFGKTDWTALESKMLDERYCALSFFSEAGFRFFLPAYLIADLRGELLTADPLFHLYHGFSSVTSEIPVESRKFTRISGGNSLLNPRRYGAMTWTDHARHRLAAFTREEAQAVIAYMTYKVEHDPRASSDRAWRLLCNNSGWTARKTHPHGPISRPICAKKTSSSRRCNEKPEKSSSDRLPDAKIACIQLCS